MTRIYVRANTGQALELQVMDCFQCGVLFGVAATYDARRRDDGREFCCPNGHQQCYTETKADRERARADRLRAQLTAQQDQTEAAELEVAKVKASEARLRWRVGNGVCPCCSRTFPGLAAHVAAKHPGFLSHDLDRLSPPQVRMLAAIREASDAGDAALVSPSDFPGDWRTIRALQRRGLVDHVGTRVALTEAGWPLAEQAAHVEARR